MAESQGRCAATRVLRNPGNSKSAMVAEGRPLTVMAGRTKPYTELGITRMSCAKCGAQASTQWQICSDGNLYRPICEACDIALNELILRWFGFTNWRTKMSVYRRTRSE